MAADASVSELHNETYEQAVSSTVISLHFMNLKYMKLNDQLNATNAALLSTERHNATSAFTK
jgi:hypothetical protein